MRFLRSKNTTKRNEPAPESVSETEELTQRFCTKCGAKLKPYVERFMVTGQIKYWGICSNPDKLGNLSEHDVVLLKTEPLVFEYDPKTGAKI